MLSRNGLCLMDSCCPHRCVPVTWVPLHAPPHPVGGVDFKETSHHVLSSTKANQRPFLSRLVPCMATASSCAPCEPWQWMCFLKHAFHG